MLHRFADITDIESYRAGLNDIVAVVVVKQGTKKGKKKSGILIGRIVWPEETDGSLHINDQVLRKNKNETNEA